MMIIPRSPRNGIARLVVPLVCSGMLATAAIAADRPSDTDIDVLLSKIEQQIASGHAVSPTDDNAMVTWRRVLNVGKPELASARSQSALTSFVVRLRLKAGEQKAAGHVVVGSDMTVFADEADRLLGAQPTEAAGPPAAMPGPSLATSSPATPSPATPSPASPPPTKAASSPAPVRTAAKAATPLAPAVSPPVAVAGSSPASVLRDAPKFEPLSAALPAPSPAQPQPAPPPAPLDEAVVRSASVPGDLSQGEYYARKGDVLLASGDILAASKFYENAAKAGSVRAAVALTSLAPFLQGPAAQDTSGSGVPPVVTVAASPPKPPHKAAPAPVRVVRRVRATPDATVAPP
jgi:hypothetical protein